MYLGNYTKYAAQLTMEYAVLLYLSRIDLSGMLYLSRIDLSGMLYLSYHILTIEEYLYRQYMIGISPESIGDST